MNKAFYFTTIFPGVPERQEDYESQSLPEGFAKAIAELESKLGLEVWLLIQDAKQTREQALKDSFNELGPLVARAFFNARHSGLRARKRIALLIDSLGGQARATYEVAMLLRRHCGGFSAVVPRHAKSAATLLTLGADEIVFNRHAELGPLDVQIFDPDREEWLSGLDEVQTLERLHASAMATFDRMMLMLLDRTHKKAKSLMPLAIRFSTQLMEPMLQGIDVVRFTQMSRLLKVAEEYGRRLLEQGYGEDGQNIANYLVEKYPEHGFPIYSDELRKIGLKVADVSDDVIDTLERITQYLPNLNAIGRIVEVKGENEHNNSQAAAIG